MRVAFAGGGTGGHVFPVRSLIQHIESHSEYKNKADALVRFGEHASLEEEVAQEFSHVTFVRIHSGKIRRGASFYERLRNIADLFTFAYGILECVVLLKKYKIDVIFSKGGYVSLPVVIAGRLLRKRVLLHESDTKPGLSNRICAKFATKIFTGFAGVFPKKEQVIGQILSDDLVPESMPNTGDEKTHILVTGGSQGAESVYTPLAALIKKNLYRESHFHVVLGTKNIGLKHLFEGLPNVTCYEFLLQKEMGGLLALCDVALTRGGTNSLAEQKLFGLKLVIVPIPRTHDQARNAAYYEKHYNDIVVKQDESFLLQLPIALEKVMKHKKNRKSNDLKEKISNAKNIVAENIFS